MIYIDTFQFTLTFLYSYMLIYNLSLAVIFYTLLQDLSNDLNTLHSFSNIGNGTVASNILTLAMLSMAGVPPFWGFFANVLIFVWMSFLSFVFLDIFFFTLIFLSLYFYVQNIRYLNSSNVAFTNLSWENNLSTVPVYFYFTYLISFLLLFGFIFMDDLILYFNWLTF